MRWILLIIACVLLFSACGDDASTDTRRGSLQLFLTDQPVELKEVWVTITDIEVHRTGEAWIPFAASGDSFDLLTLQDRQTLLESAALEEGKYTGIRFFISEGHVIDQNEERCDLNVPSGKIHIPVNFDIENGEETSILLDFDAAQSVHVIRTGNNARCNLRPVIHPVSVTGPEN